jgi:hypothetical protein
MRESPSEGGSIRNPSWVLFSEDAIEHGNAPHPDGLLRPRCERPCSRAAKERDELAALHSMISSARPRSVSGIVSPSALAVLRFTISSTFVLRWTGRSAGLSPFEDAADVEAGDAPHLAIAP